MTLDRAAICIQPCVISVGGNDIGYTDTPFEWYPEVVWEPILTEQLGVEPVDFEFQGVAAYGTVRLMQYDTNAMNALLKPWNSSKTATYPNASVVAGMSATELSATQALIVTPTKTAAKRQKLTIYNGLVTVARGAQFRWAQRANVGMPLIVFALRDGSGNGWKLEPSA